MPRSVSINFAWHPINFPWHGVYLLTLHGTPHDSGHRTPPTKKHIFEITPKNTQTTQRQHLFQSLHGNPIKQHEKDYPGPALSTKEFENF